MTARRRRRASARTYRWDAVEPPRTQVRRAQRYFGYGSRDRRGYARCLRFVNTVDASDRQDTRHALASKPAISTEWQLGTLNGSVGVIVSIMVGAIARIYEQRMDRRMAWTKLRRGDPFEVPSAALQFELQRHLQIHPLRDFVFVVAAGAVVVGTKLQPDTPRVSSEQHDPMIQFHRLLGC